MKLLALYCTLINFLFLYTTILKSGYTRYIFYVETGCTSVPIFLRSLSTERTRTSSERTRTSSELFLTSHSAIPLHITHTQINLLYGWSRQLALSILRRYDWFVSRIRHSFKFVQNRSKIFW